jgi:acetyl-CoA carboxylase carboxyltransferase component
VSDWDALLAELAARRQAARAMGGSERVARLMTARGKLDARARLDLLFDAGSFVEIGSLVGGPDVPCDALVAGMGRVDGRPVLAGAEDFTVLGGSIGSGSMAKRFRICELALQERVPLVWMLDGAGHRLTDTGGGRAPNDLLALADLAGHVPMVCLVLGASAGHGALTAPLSDFVIMTDSACMFTGGPPLVKEATGEDVTKEELGGARLCTEVSGVAHSRVPDDPAAIALARRYLGYFPSNAGGTPPRRSGSTTARRLLDGILDVIPVNARRPYEMHRVLDLLVDEATLLEVQPLYGKPLICALAFVGGHAVAIVANNPAEGAGAIDSAAAIKGADFLTTVGAFGLPVLFLADNPGIMAGTAAERAGILKWGGRMYRAQRALRGPKLHVTFRKAFGFGTSIMAQNPFDRQTLTYAFPSLTLGAMPASSGGRSAKLDDEERARLAREQSQAAWRIAAGMGVDEVIDPRELRNALIDGLELAANRRRPTER